MSTGSSDSRLPTAIVDALFGNGTKTVPRLRENGLKVARKVCTENVRGDHVNPPYQYR
jgi:hypothetical protein